MNRIDLFTAPTTTTATAAANAAASAAHDRGHVETKNAFDANLALYDERGGGREGSSKLEDADPRALRKDDEGDDKDDDKDDAIVNTLVVQGWPSKDVSPPIPALPMPSEMQASITGLMDRQDHTEGAGAIASFKGDPKDLPIVTSPGRSSGPDAPASRNLATLDPPELTLPDSTAPEAKTDTKPAGGSTTTVGSEEPPMLAPSISGIAPKLQLARAGIPSFSGLPAPMSGPRATLAGAASAMPPLEPTETILKKAPFVTPSSLMLSRPPASGAHARAGLAGDALTSMADERPPSWASVAQPSPAHEATRFIGVDTFAAIAAMNAHAMAQPSSSSSSDAPQVATQSGIQPSPQAAPGAPPKTPARSLEGATSKIKTSALARDTRGPGDDLASQKSDASFAMPAPAMVDVGMTAAEPNANGSSIVNGSTTTAGAAVKNEGGEASRAVQAAESLGHKRTLASGEAHGQVHVPELGRIEVTARAHGQEAATRIDVHVRAEEDHARHVIMANASEMRSHVRVEVPNAVVHVERPTTDFTDDRAWSGGGRPELATSDQSAGGSQTPSGQSGRQSNDDGDTSLYDGASSVRRSGAASVINPRGRRARFVL